MRDATPEAISTSACCSASARRGNRPTSTQKSSNCSSSAISSIAPAAHVFPKSGRHCRGRFHLCRASPPLEGAKTHETPSPLLAVLGGALGRVRGAYRDLRQDRRRQ